MELETVEGEGVEGWWRVGGKSGDTAAQPDSICVFRVTANENPLYCRRVVILVFPLVSLAFKKS